MKFKLIEKSGNDYTDINSLCKNNIITKDKKGYIIKDLVGLEDLAEDLF